MSDIRTLADLHHDPQNARRHTPRNVGMIERALHEVGAARSIVVDENGVVLAGNATIEAAAAAGIERVQVVDADGQTIIAVRRSGLSPEQKAHLALYDNRAAELAEWDTDVLASLGAEIDLSQFWTKDELAALIVEDVPLGGGDDEFDTTPDEGPTRVQPGELWQLGRHRLLCGDSTKREDVERLMDGEQPRLIYTDPPYGVDYDGGTKVRERLQGDTSTAMYDAALAALSYADDTPLYMWFSLDRHSGDVFAALDRHGWDIRAFLIWNKNQAQFGALSAQYKEKKEPLIYAHRKGHAPAWYGPTNEVTVWDCDRAPSNDYHPTQKPIELAERAMRNSSKPGDIVADFFGGSGATLIAGERQRRRVYMMEVSPAYCDVILRRFEAETGLTAERLDG